MYRVRIYQLTNKMFLYRYNIAKKKIHKRKTLTRDSEGKEFGVIFFIYRLSGVESSQRKK